MPVDTYDFMECFPVCDKDLLFMNTKKSALEIHGNEIVVTFK